MREASPYTELMPSLPKEEFKEKGEIVSIFVNSEHPLLQLKQSLPWEAIHDVMVRRWRTAGKNVDGRPGQSWDVSLYVPVIVLMCVKHFTCREMEEYLSENVVARVFISRHGDPAPQIRDHSNIARCQWPLELSHFWPLKMGHFVQKNHTLLILSLNR